MLEMFSPVHIVILAAVTAVFLVPGILYILTLQKALNKCAYESRTIEPWLLWLDLIPLVNLVVSFFIVIGMANTLRNEFNRRGIYVPDATPGQSIGIAMSVCRCLVFIPLLGGLAALVLWIIYWVKMAEYSGRLDLSPQRIPPASAI